MRLLDAVGSGPVGGKVRQCPAHVDAAPSLSVNRGEDGRVLVLCFAGCETKDVLAALRLSWGALFRPPPVRPEEHARRARRLGLAFPALVLASGSAEGTRHEAYHPYGDRWRIERRRAPGGAKAITWETREQSGAWVPGLREVPAEGLPLYRESDVRKAVVLDEPVVVVESESSVDALRGHYGTTWAGGASTPALEKLRRVLGDHERVLVIADNDSAGLACADRITAALPLARVLVPEVEGEDARDLHARVGEPAFRALVDHALHQPPGRHDEGGRTDA